MGPVPDLELYLFGFNHSVNGNYFFEDIRTDSVIAGDKGNLFAALLS